MEAKRLGGWWRLWIVLSIVWIAFMLCLGFISMHWPNIEDLRLERVSAACTTYEDGKPLVLNRIYSEEKLRETSMDTKYSTETWWPDLRRCVASMDVDYGTVRRTEAIQTFVPMILSTILLPLLFLIAGVALSWIARGFRRS